MGLVDFLFGSNDKLKQISNYTPQQNQLLQSLFPLLQQMQQGGYGNAMNLLQQYLNPESDVYKNFEQPYLDQYNDDIGRLSERFAGAGALGSSGFAQSLGAASGNLRNNLASLKSGMQRDSIGTLLNQYNNLQNTALGAQPFTYMNRQGNAGLIPTALGGFAANQTPGSYSGLAKLLSGLL